MEISPELREVIQYMDSGAVTGTYSQELAEAVSAVKANEERRLEYMTMAIHEMEIREEGREEGRILGNIDVYRETGMDDQSIIAAIQKKFGLTQEEAERYVLPPVSA